MDRFRKQARATLPVLQLAILKIPPEVQMRNTRQFQQVLDAARRAAEAHKEQQDRLAEAMEERYGVTHSDADQDALIDSLSYGAGWRVTVDECDRLMAAAGYPRTQP